MKSIIEDTFAEAFPMKAVRIIITALNLELARKAAISMTGFATSVIACGCEGGIEVELSEMETPDNRPGVSVLLFSMSRGELAKQLETRVGQCVLTCPTTSVFNGLDSGEELNLAKNLRFFGDGWQISKVWNAKRYWRIPTMDGEFVGEEKARWVKAIGGGNLIIIAESTDIALKISECGVKVIQNLPNVITPFPGGIVRSGSKVGSKYKSLPASTNNKFCPALFGFTKDSKLPSDSSSVMEIVVDGLAEVDVEKAMSTAMAEMMKFRGKGLIQISAGNYGGKLGPYHFYLKKILEKEFGAERY
ncbi:MAG: formylmethanofuran--tetrahydromethanopterin N-formyltransferase [Betaproteobacteria bacterium TMED82]|nr:MAG: formylmethanofuran--tetrahydromethanopterin N-formyltransferase [Betaproteobacteria bacterium TMED82]|tara:strand:- start:25304 stop:26215 length:912 start_codon:yes stop_codon:yes gene_type:complete